MNDYSYNIANMDFREFVSQIEDESIDLIATDPPYPTISGGTPPDKRRPSGILAKNDGKIFRHNNIKPSDYLPECFRVLKQDTHIYVFTNELNLDITRSDLKKAGFKIHNTLVAKKRNATPNRWGMKNCEYVILARKGKAKPFNNCSFMTVHDFGEVPRGNERLHETQKPVSLMSTYILNSTKEGEVVFDPFMGSGSTGVAAMMEGREFIGCEIDSKYYEIARNRMESLEHETIY